MHYVLYLDDQIIGYAHIQLWKDMRKAMRIIVVEEEYRNNGNGNMFLAMCEDKIKKLGYKVMHTESAPMAEKYYRRNGYIDAAFNDPDGYEGSPEDVPLAKKLL